MKNNHKDGCDMGRRVAGRARVVSYQPSLMEVTLQLIVLIVAALLLNACTATGQPRIQTAVVQGLSEEVSIGGSWRRR